MTRTNSPKSHTGSATTPADSARLRLIDAVVRPSFERCCAAEPSFFDDFYFNLSDRLPVVGSMFAHVNMDQQNRLIRDGIANLIAFAAGDSRAKGELNRLSISHSRNGLGIAPDFYPHWVNSLMETVRQHDVEATDETETAWRDVLTDGIALMTSGY